MSKKVRRQAIGVALFPFLAVLICTMGALIVLLVLLVQQASLDAQEVVKERARSREAAVDPLAAERKVAKEKVEDEQWRQGILEGQRTSRAEELANARLRVSHLADHISRLQDQARTLMARAQEIDRGQAATSSDLTAEQTELAKMQAEITRRKMELDAKKKELAAKDRSYALIPYDGPNGTKRRPIYIECARRGVILQPEGLILGPEDFSGPLNPGNPLDAALRAIRETWKRSGEPGEPYPLLVVRPDGIVAYQAARQALRGWDDEFGYELVDDEKKLDFGGPNPAMQRMLEQIVGSARERQVMLAAAMPRKFQGEDTLTSFAPEDQPELQEAIVAARGSGGLGNGNGEFAGGGGVAGNGGYNAGGNSPGIGTQRQGGQYAGGPGSGGNSPGPNAQYAAANNSVKASRAGQGSGTATGNSAQGSPAPGNTGASGQAGTGQAGTGQAGSGQPGSGQPGSGQPGSGQQARLGSSPGSSNVSSGQPAGAGQGSPSSGQQSSQAGSSGGSASSGAASGQKSAQTKTSSGSGKGNSNWGLPGAQGRTTAVTRPIRVVCLPDKLVVVPERGDDRAASIIAVSPEMQPAEVDAFVVAVQKHLNAWGPAMTNGYWKPVLQVEVTRAGEPQFETLQMLLRGSGFELQRKKP